MSCTGVVVDLFTSECTCAGALTLGSMRNVSFLISCFFLRPFERFTNSADCDFDRPCLGVVLAAKAVRVCGSFSSLIDPTDRALWTTILSVLVVVRLMGDWFGDEGVTVEVGDFGPFGLGVILPDVFTDPLGDFFADPLGVEPLVVLNLGTTFWVSVQWTGASAPVSVSTRLAVNL